MSLQERLSWYYELRKGLMGLWVSLNKRGEDLGVLSEVTKESISAPPPHDLHSLYGHTIEEVEEGGADTVMSLSVAMREPTKTNASALGSSITKN